MSAPPSRQLRLPERLHLPPVWTIAVAVLVAGAVVAWEIVNGAALNLPAAMLHPLLWPGAAVFLAVYIFAWLGWALDID